MSFTTIFEFIQLYYYTIYTNVTNSKITTGTQSVYKKLKSTMRVSYRIHRGA